MDMAWTGIPTAITNRPRSFACIIRTPTASVGSRCEVNGTKPAKQLAAPDDWTEASPLSILASLLTYATELAISEAGHLRPLRQLI
jgi:hypothetical protein